MEQRHRDIITSNLVELVNQTNLDALLPKLVETGIFTNAMLERYTNNNIDSRERKQNLYLHIQGRGPEAFQNLISSLLRTGHIDLAQLLQPDINVREFFLEEESHLDGPTLRNLPEYILEENEDLNPRLRNMVIQDPQDVISFNTEPISIIVKKASERKDLLKSVVPIYRMGTKPRGYLFMINNIEFVNNIEEVRNGALVDEMNLAELFKQLGFIVIPAHRNQGLEDMKRKIREFAHRREHANYDCCVVAIMSHGRQGHYDGDTNIVASDGHTLSIAWVLEQFTNENAPRLTSIPKIFFFQSCRGDSMDYGVKMTTGRIQTDGFSNNILVRTMTDLLIGYSTLPGYKSMRDKYNGSWYIQTICEVFQEHACDTDIEDMLKIVDQKMASLASAQFGRQTSSYENRGFRKLYFNPGLHNEQPSPAGSS